MWFQKNRNKAEQKVARLKTVDDKMATYMLWKIYKGGFLLHIWRYRYVLCAYNYFIYMYIALMCCWSNYYVFDTMWLTCTVTVQYNAFICIPILFSDWPLAVSCTITWYINLDVCQVTDINFYCFYIVHNNLLFYTNWISKSLLKWKHINTVK